ncbi:hypothetical protein [uncultured Winogradskyella sp.]|uniref:hypothetical protein n=1 Tax=uncultured Winogradskyella sp. TaxID=395353 RepID=UPI0026273AB2|nr:hypothetical protein [uncultured Winogradskyella sp.]
MKKSIQLFLCLFLFSALIQAQQRQLDSCNSTSTNRTIQFDGSSEQQAIIIDVSKDTNKMHVSINSTVKSGYLTVELYDPKGNKKGNFSIESQVNTSEKKEQVCGQMQKHIEDPVNGKWTVLLVPNKVIGDVSICTSLHNE